MVFLKKEMKCHTLLLILVLLFWHAAVAMSGEVDYLARTGVPQLMDKLICELLDSKPEDPVAFMHAALRRMESRVLFPSFPCFIHPLHPSHCTCLRTNKTIYTDMR